MEQLKQKKERHKISSKIKGLLYSGVKRRDHRSFSSEEKKKKRNREKYASFKLGA